jgi:hypothetical protein
VGTIRTTTCAPVSCSKADRRDSNAADSAADRVLVWSITLAVSAGTA